MDVFHIHTKQMVSKVPVKWLGAWVKS